ncbi:MAG TPA: DoxX family protein [Candidatus Krumholzibacteria bacterium]
MNIALWIAQGLLAIIFAVSAVVKGTWDLDRLVNSGQTGVQGLPLPLVRFIAFAEGCGALGLILPWATGIAPVLTVAAAVALGVIMVLAAVVHTRLHEPKNVAKNLVLLALCAFVALGRRG